MPDKSCLQFNGYTVDKITFSMAKSMNENQEFQITPIFGIHRKDLGEDKYDIQLSVSIEATKDNPLPFSMEVIMTGKFSACFDDIDGDLKNSIINDNTVAIMFPFLRSTIASLTTAANVPTLILPIMNFTGVLKNGSSMELK